MQLTVEAWHKPEPASTSQALGLMRLDIDEKAYRSLEKIERKLQDSEEREAYLPVNPDELHLKIPSHCERLSDCQIRVYLRDEDDSGLFHLVGRRAGGDGLVYTNAVMLRTVAS
jgi:hypothetical protein